MKALKSSKPFYKKHKKAVVNAEIRTDDKTHRAFLYAMSNIKKDEEITSTTAFLEPYYCSHCVVIGEAYNQCRKNKN